MIMFYMDKFQRETKIKGGGETEKRLPHAHENLIQSLLTTLLGLNT